MLGAIAGDVIGSVYERHNLKSTEFELFGRFSRFTDDTVLTVATADALMSDGDFAAAYRKWYARYPRNGYGGRFRRWAARPDAGPYYSFGNGSAMRVSPVAWFVDGFKAVQNTARASALVTHDHPDGVAGAQALAGAVYLARRARDKEEIRTILNRTFEYDFTRTVEAIRPSYRFDVSCRGSVPEAIIAFLDSIDFEDAIRKAVSLGGDSDTIACMAGAVAEAYYGGVPRHIEIEVLARLPDDMRSVTESFRKVVAAATAPRQEPAMR
ncbi:MAG: ADP-ribosylglycohydrolase family protein [Proteobacteria bacterium]|nr:MAG: ADP-ribosylglycohydrolase family protein [Pseudomonadota bacterium]